MTLNETMRSVAQEYARLFCQVIGCSGYEYIHQDTYDVCIFDGAAYSFTLSDMMVVIDNLDGLVKIYGSREKVGNEIRTWHTWAFSRPYNRIDREHQSIMVMPRLSLRDWLYGSRKLNQAETEESLLIKREVLTSLCNDSKEHPEEDKAIDEFDELKDALREIEARIKRLNRPIHNDDESDNE